MLHKQVIQMRLRNDLYVIQMNRDVGDVKNCAKDLSVPSQSEITR